MLQLELITNVARLSELHSAWLQLEHRSQHQTPFQTREWLLTWWHHFGSGQLRVFAVRDGDELVGVIPAFLHNWEGRRQLTLIGSGISDFLDPLIASDRPEDVLNCLFAYLAAATEWEVCNWQDLANPAPISHAASIYHLKIEPKVDIPCSEICLDGPFSAYWKGRPSGLRRNVRRYREKAEQLAPVQTEIADYLDAEHLNALIGLHSERWREQGEIGMIAANHSSAFLRDVACKLASRQLIRTFALRFHGAIAAVILAFPYRQALYAYLSAFDPAHASFGFGRILLFDALQYAFANEFKSWNFLRGTEPYKLEWGAQQVSKTRLIIQHQ